jgi:mannose-6-phosphate isomerase-like protein (cupin superfamily)
MKKIEFSHSRDLAFRRVADFAPESFLDILSKEERQTEVRTHFPGNQDRLFLMEIRDVPDTQSTHHAHEKDEIFFILEGEMHFGSRVCSAGDSVQILGGTVYTFRTGSDGCRYLKFTATADNSFIPKDQFQEPSTGT